MAAQHPAAVAAGWEVAMQVCDLLFKALSAPLPDRVPAGTKGCICNVAFGGVNQTTDEYFTYYETIAGRNPVVRIDAAIRSASGARVQHRFSLFPPENSLFDQTNSLFRGVGNSKLKPHDISGLGGFDPAYSRPNPRNSLFFPCKTGKSGQRRVRSRLRPPPASYFFSRRRIRRRPAETGHQPAGRR